MAEVISDVVSLDRLVADLSSFPAEEFGERATEWVRTHQVDPASVAPYSFFLTNGYTRNLIFKNEVFELLALCWEPGQVSSIHNHRDQQCWMLMAQGTLENQNYLVRDRDPAARTCRLEESDRMLVSRDEPLAVDPEEPVHQIRNLRRFGGRAISLHIYSRPFDSCEVYCPEKGVYGDVKLSYWSVYGRLVHAPQDAGC